MKTHCDKTRELLREIDSFKEDIEYQLRRPLSEFDLQYFMNHSIEDILKTIHSGIEELNDMACKMEGGLEHKRDKIKELEGQIEDIQYDHKIEILELRKEIEQYQT